MWRLTKQHTRTGGKEKLKGVYEDRGRHEARLGA